MKVIQIQVNEHTNYYLFYPKNQERVGIMGAWISRLLLLELFWNQFNDDIVRIWARSFSAPLGCNGLWLRHAYVFLCPHFTRLQKFIDLPYGIDGTNINLLLYWFTKVM